MKNSAMLRGRPKKINVPLKSEEIRRLVCGDFVLLCGPVYTMRDMSQKKLVMAGKRALPLNRAAVYYCAPTDSKTPRRPVGACGPTTTARMEKDLGFLLDAGVKAVIGKGPITEASKKLLKKNGCVYLLAAGGCGAYYSKFVKDAKVIMFGELGPEAVWRLEVKDFPLIVGCDTKGADIFGNAYALHS